VPANDRVGYMSARYAIARWGGAWDYQPLLYVDADILFDRRVAPMRSPSAEMTRSIDIGSWWIDAYAAARMREPSSSRTLLLTRAAMKRATEASAGLMRGGMHRAIIYRQDIKTAVFRPRTAERFYR